MGVKPQMPEYNGTLETLLPPQSTDRESRPREKQGPTAGHTHRFPGLPLSSCSPLSDISVSPGHFSPSF